jgi:hypothetical protein
MTTPIKKITVTGYITSISVTTERIPPVTGPLTVTDTSLGITSDFGGTSKLVPGMSIVFFSSLVGIEAGVVYKISADDFSSTSFKITENNTLKLAVESSSTKITFVAYQELTDSNGASLVFHTDSNTPVIDYTEQFDRIVQLGSEEGFYTLSPYEYIGLVSSYKELTERGAVFNEPTIQKSATKAAADRVQRYRQTLRNLPKLKD